MLDVDPGSARALASVEQGVRLIDMPRGVVLAEIRTEGDLVTARFSSDGQAAIVVDATGVRVLPLYAESIDTVQENIQEISNIKKRGCVIIRDVFDDKMIQNLNEKLEKYIDENNYYEDQKKKSNLDKYFSELQSAKPQIYGLYWS